MKRKIYITEGDKQKLKGLCRRTIGLREKDMKNLMDLAEELERAEVINNENLPGDVITMNSTVRIQDLKTGDELVYTIVYPENANIEEKRISILAPIGTALIGYRVGDTIEWEVPAGKRYLKVKEIIYQPEAAGKIAAAK